MKEDLSQQTQLITFLQHRSDLQFNPFLDSRYLISMLEIFHLKAPKELHVSGIIITFSEFSLILRFGKEDLIKAIFVCLCVLNHPFAYDNKARAYVGTRRLLRFGQVILDFEEMYSALSDLECYEIEIRFSKKNPINVFSQTVFFEVDAYHDDDFFLKKELARWGECN